MGELELGLPVSREAEHHDVRGGRRVEDRIGRAPDHRIRDTGEPDERRTGAVLPVNDPDGGRHGFPAQGYNETRRICAIGVPTRLAPTAPRTRW